MSQVEELVNHPPGVTFMQAPQLELCVEQTHIAVSNFLQALCLNRPRVRRRLRSGIEDWQRMRTHALNADHSDELVTFLLSSKSGWALEVGPDMVGPCSVSFSPAMHCVYLLGHSLGRVHLLLCGSLRSRSSLHVLLPRHDGPLVRGAMWCAAVDQ
jgi:hypothetical protein